MKLESLTLRNVLSSLASGIAGGAVLLSAFAFLCFPEILEFVR
jgi:hypothetical protein